MTATPRTRAYRDGALTAEGFPLDSVSDHLDHPGTVVWVDLLDPAPEQLTLLAAELGLHPLAVEDALGPHQRPKVDYYPTHLFMSCHALRFDLSTATLLESEVDAFMSDHWLITVRKDEGFGLDATLARWDRTGAVLRHGVAALLHGLLDVIVDGYFEAVQAFDDYYEEVSGELFAEHPLPPTEQEAWFRVRRALLRFHRLVSPLREAVGSLLRRDHGFITEDLYPYYQDVYDHILRINESTESLRDLTATIVETNLSLRDYRQNQIMKQVTSWAAILAVPTLITGYYGMNVPYPGAGEPWGAVASAVLMFGISGALYLMFRRKDWL